MNASDNDEEHPAPGAAPAAKTIKAGCGIRFDPDTLSEDVGFDFSDATGLLPSDTEEDADGADHNTAT